jgi:DNA (cytosine-5)-methyltransferase 1
MKILNLYAGIGGNRKLWGDEHQITAVELNPEIAKIYQDFFPNDTVIVADAHEYLLDNISEYDFIWSSVPCQSHSRARYWTSKGGRYSPIYPDMKLWQEIIFLRKFAECLFTVENVIPYYDVFINPDAKIQRHLFWSNIPIYEPVNLSYQISPFNITGNTITNGFDITGYKLSQRKDQVVRNTMNPEIGLHILNCAMGIIREENTPQLKLTI